MGGRFDPVNTTADYSWPGESMSRQSCTGGGEGAPSLESSPQLSHLAPLFSVPVLYGKNGTVLSVESAAGGCWCLSYAHVDPGADPNSAHCLPFVPLLPALPTARSHAPLFPSVHRPPFRQRVNSRPATGRYHITSTKEAEQSSNTMFIFLKRKQALGANAQAGSKCTKRCSQTSSLHSQQHSLRFKQHVMPSCCEVYQPPPVGACRCMCLSSS